MKKSFRDFVQALDDAGEMMRVAKPVDMRRLSSLMSQSDKAVMFENIADYPDWRVAGALITSRARLISWWRDMTLAICDGWTNMPRTFAV